MNSRTFSDTLSKLSGFLSRPPYRTGIALSGGGARGFAHIGVLKAMNERGIYPDVVAGVSAGAVAAVFYAAHIPFEKMISAFEEVKFGNLTALSMPKDGFFKLDRFAEFLNRHIPYRRLEELPVKTVVCATDIERGKAVTFTEGPLAECVMASCSIPVVFKPRIIDGIKYVDGGVLHNLPAWAIREQCRTLYGVNVSPLIRHTKPVTSVVEMAVRSFKLMSKSNAAQDMALCDRVIQIDDIANYNVFNLAEIRQIYLLGYKTTLRTLSQL